MRDVSLSVDELREWERVTVAERIKKAQEQKDSRERMSQDFEDEYGPGYGSDWAIINGYD